MLQTWSRNSSSVRVAYTHKRCGWVNSSVRSMAMAALAVFLFAFASLADGLPQQSVAAATPSSSSSSSGSSAKKTSKKKTSKKHHSRHEPTQKAPTADRISEIQSALARGGYYQGTPNGKWDTSTVDAMQKFQSANGLTPSGKLDALSLQKMGLGSDIAGVSAPKPLPVSSETGNGNTSLGAAPAAPEHVNAPGSPAASPAAPAAKPSPSTAPPSGPDTKPQNR